MFASIEETNYRQKKKALFIWAYLTGMPIKIMGVENAQLIQCNQD